MTVASVRDLVVGPVSGGAPVVDGVSFSLQPGQVLGLVGRSGSGKSTAAYTLLGHVRPGLAVRGGSVRVAGLDPFVAARQLRGRVVSYLGQDPAAALNPARRIGAQLAEVVRLRGGSVSSLLSSVQLPSDRGFLRRFSHQVSGGQAQRVGLAMALAGSPRLLVLDEPTSGLDVVVAAEVRALLASLLGGPAAVVVSHDPYLVAELADSVVTMADGRLVSGAASVRPVVPASEAAAGPDALVVSSLAARYGVSDVSLRIPSGSALALVGPSGSGKTTVARAIVGLQARTSGIVMLDGRPLAPHYRQRALSDRRAVQLVAQDSVGALNPRETVGAALVRAGSRDVASLLDRVHLPADCASRLPGELSGGERQRVNICRALAASPRLLVCDEVTSALDREIGSAVLSLLAELRDSLGLAVLLVTHDLSVAAEAAQQIAVLERGRVVEVGSTARVLSSPDHSLTRALVACSPGLRAA
jgi:peptide/nickel transport system ATP-binding protein